jgi:transcriptional regulator NrdR family protein
MSDRIFCPTCEKETDGVLSSRETDSDGYMTETYQCYECMGIFDCVSMPKDMHIVVCQGCAAAWTFGVPEGKRVQVKLTCQCGATTEYDSAAREAIKDE